MTPNVGDKRALMRAIKSALPDAERGTLIGTATYLADNLEWDLPRKRVLVGLSDVGVTLERFAEMQAAAVTDRDFKRSKAKAGMVLRGSIKARFDGADTTSVDAAPAKPHDGDAHHQS